MLLISYTISTIFALFTNKSYNTTNGLEAQKNIVEQQLL